MLSQKPPLSSSSPGAHVGPQLLILLLTGLLVPPAVRASDDFKYRATKAADASGAAAHKAGPSQIAPVPLTLLPDNPFGAKCLDGSPPGYYLRPARASQSRFWHIHLPGGGWCTTEDSCAYRAGRRLGSSHLWAPEINPMWLPGILSANPNVNPGFGEWNMAMAVYCDGGGYVGRRGEVAVAGNRTLFMDGWKIVMAILDDLSSRGLMAAQQVLVTGESAGGQAVVNLCDYIAAYLSFANVKCLADGAFFIDTPDRRGRSFFREIAENATQLHQMFNPKCNQALPAEAQWRCFFPQYSLTYVTSDIFILNTILDPIALMIGNQLPFDKTHATQCLFDIRWGAGGGAGLWGRGGGFWAGGTGGAGGGAGLGGGGGGFRGGEVRPGAVELGEGVLRHPGKRCWVVMGALFSRVLSWVVAIITKRFWEVVTVKLVWVVLTLAYRTAAAAAAAHMYHLGQATGMK
ncbi:hypothetical protein CLOP_g21060 [Closterium sp. NIES-67]|nr:hypothetical protein CLOP_g21060 [Closterium sp. NIES-67]